MFFLTKTYIIGINYLLEKIDFWKTTIKIEDLLPNHANLKLIKKPQLILDKYFLYHFY